MSVQSAVAYIHRMREDEAFRQLMNETSDDEEACWAILRDNGFSFTLSEFKEAQEEIYKEFGVTPM